MTTSFLISHNRGAYGLAYVIVSIDFHYVRKSLYYKFIVGLEFSVHADFAGCHNAVASSFLGVPPVWKAQLTFEIFLDALYGQI